MVEKNSKIALMGSIVLTILIIIVGLIVVLTLTGNGFWVVVGAGNVGVQDTFGSVNPTIITRMVRTILPINAVVLFIFSTIDIPHIHPFRGGRKINTAPVRDRTARIALKPSVAAEFTG